MRTKNLFTFATFSLPLPLLILFVSFLHANSKEIIVSDRHHHLGNDATPEWTEAPSEPGGPDLTLEFEGQPNRKPWTLRLTQRDVNDTWILTINATPITELTRGSEPTVFYYPIPEGVLKTGSNTLHLSSAKSTDDIVVGKISILKESFQEALKLGSVKIKVVEQATGRPIPARITLVSSEGKLEKPYFAEAETTAVRTGVVYTGTGDASLDLPEGDYILYATRGMEWSLGKVPVEVKKGVLRRVTIRMTREVDTTGFVAADTHIHTLTHSGHGDASMEERVITIAGEGIEFAVATDHNHNTDYRPLQKQLELTSYYTPVVGNEVTTDNGHFNAFPLDPEQTPPPHQEKDWAKLTAGIRRKGAKVVILNHPRWPTMEKGPFGVFSLNRISGDRPGGETFDFDCLELYNSTTPEEDTEDILIDWFSLLNHGDLVSAVGSSDSHTVGDPVGLGRTYVRSSSDDPQKLKIPDLCEAFLRGEISASQGIFADVSVNGKPMGSLVRPRAETVEVLIRVAAPSWIVPESMTIYINGTPVHESAIQTRPGFPTNERLRVKLKVSRQDGWLVCVVRGSKPDGPYWVTGTPATGAITNPVFLDLDGDGKFETARDIARQILTEAGSDQAKLRDALTGVDPAVAVQVASLVREVWLKEVTENLRSLGQTPDQKEAVERFLQSSSE